MNVSKIAETDSASSLEAAMNDSPPPPYRSPSPSSSSSSSDSPASTASLKSREESTKHCVVTRLWTKFLANYTCAAFFIFVVLHLSLIAAFVCLFVTGYNILPLHFDNIAIRLHHHPQRLRNDAWQYEGNTDAGEGSVRNLNHYMFRNLGTHNRKKRDIMASKMAPPTSNEHQYRWGDIRGRYGNRLRDYHMLSISVVLEDPKGNMFSRENLVKVAKLEYEIFKNPRYRNLCLTAKMGGFITCVPMRSPLRLFDGSANKFETFDLGFDNISQGLSDFLETDEDSAKIFLGVDNEIDASRGVARSDVTRFYFDLGEPVVAPGREGTIEDSAAIEYAGEELMKMLGGLVEDGFMGLKVYYGGGNWFYFNGAMKQVFKDWYFLLASLAFILVFIYFQTGSLWITTWGLLGIVFSFVEANLFYNVVLGYKYIGVFQVLALFLALGIGADDIFVFIDTWKYLEKKSFDSLADRLAECYQRAGKSMMVTTLTSVAAFIVSALCPMLSVESFGVFTACVIVINYLSVLTLLPAAVILHHKYFSQFHCLCCCSTKTNAVTEQNGAQAQKKYFDINQKVVEFMQGPIFKMATHRKFRWVLIVIPIVLMVGAIAVIATMMRPPPENYLQIFRDGHYLQQHLMMENQRFLVNDGDRKVKMYILFGLKEQDRSECNTKSVLKNREECKGKKVIDKELDVNEPKSQVALWKACRRLKLAQGEEKERLKLATVPPPSKLLRGSDGRFYQRHRSQVDFEAAAARCMQDGGRLAVVNDGATSRAVESLIRDDSWIGVRKVDKQLRTFDGNVAAGNQTWTNWADGQPDAWRWNSCVNVDENGRWNEWNCDHESAFICQFEKEPTLNNTIDNDVQCFVENLNDFYLEPMRKCGVDADVDHVFPISAEMWKCFVEKNVNDNKAFHLSQSDRPFDSAVRWMNLRRYDTPGVRFSPNKPHNIESFRISATTQHVARSIGLELGLELINNWDEEFARSFGDVEGLKRGLVYCNYGESIMQTKTVVDQAILGIVVGLAVAFGMVLLVTLSLPISVIMLVTIVPIVVCVLVIIPLSGWYLGLLEGLNLCFLVGLAVDYTIHLAEAYNLSKRHGREERLKDALGHIGISILSGAVTTGGAAFFMFFAQIQFFVQFGSFIFSIVGFANLFTLTFQAALLGLFGPENDSSCCDVSCCGPSIFKRKKIAAPPTPGVETGAPSFDNKAFASGEGKY